MGIIKKAKNPTSKKQSVGSKLVGAVKGAVGMGSKSSGGRRRGGMTVSRLQNKILKLKLHKKLNKLRYGGR